MTVVAIVVLLMRWVSDRKIKRNSFLYGISAINKCYKDLFLEKSIVIKLTQCLMIILAELFCFISIYMAIIRYFDEYSNLKIDYIIKMLIIVVAFIVIHYLMGYVLLFSSKMHIFSCKSKEESIKADFLLSYFITTSFLAFLIAFPEDLYKYVVSAVIGVIICYVLNFKILLSIMKNPRSIKFSKTDESSISKVMVAALMIVAMIVTSLFLGVCIASVMESNAFSNNPSYFDLLYYTVVTFTTIGFGDISPMSASAKIMAIIISGTSIICLTVFLGNIYSYRDKRG